MPKYLHMDRLCLVIIVLLVRKLQRGMGGRAESNPLLTPSVMEPPKTLVVIGLTLCQQYRHQIADELFECV